MSDELKLTPKVISEVSQLIDRLPKITKDRIPEPIMVMFVNSKIDISKYPIDFEKSFEEQNIEPLSFQIMGRILKDLPPLVEYVEKVPKWSETEDKRKAIDIMKEEICTNLFNVHNVLASRKLAKEEYVMDVEWYGRICTEENYKALEPFIVLCRIFNICREIYEEKDNVDETYEKYMFVCNEIKKNISKL